MIVTVSMVVAMNGFTTFIRTILIVSKKKANPTFMFANTAIERPVE
jgi:hypothetical protein